MTEEIATSLISNPELDVRERAFILAYVFETHGNGYAAAKLAGYDGRDDYLRSQAVTLLARPRVRSEVDRLFAAGSMGKGELLARMADIARGLSGVCSVIEDPDGGQKVKVDFKRLIAEGRGHIIREITYDRKGNQIVKMYNAVEAMQTIGRHLQLWTDNVNLQVGMSEEDKDALQSLRAKIAQIGERTAGYDVLDGHTVDVDVIDGQFTVNPADDTLMPDSAAYGLDSSTDSVPDGTD